MKFPHESCISTCLSVSLGCLRCMLIRILELAGDMQKADATERKSQYVVKIGSASVWLIVRGKIHQVDHTQGRNRSTVVLMSKRTNGSQEHGHSAQFASRLSSPWVQNICKVNDAIAGWVMILTQHPAAPSHLDG